MAREPFLINPPRRRRKAVRRRGRKLILNAWPGDPVGHRTASRKGWTRRKKRRPGYAVPKGGRFARTSGVKRAASKRSKKRRATRTTVRSNRIGGLRRFGNPFGEEVILVGNPRRRRRKRSRSIFNPKRRRRAVSRRRRSYTRSRRRRAYAMNPVRRRRYSRRRHRRNPVELSLRRPMGLIMPLAVGVGAKYATDVLPGMIGMNTGIMKYLAKLGVMFGGQMLIGKFAGKDNGNVWAVVSGVSIAWEALQEFVFATTVAPAVAGIPYSNQDALRSYAGVNTIGAYPGEVGFGAYPFE